MLYYIGLFCVFIYIWQFIANRLKLERGCPSWVLEQIAAFFTEGFMKLGRAAVWISSFVEYVRLEMFYVPLFQLLKPLYDICISWLWFFSAYAESAAKFTNHYIIYWGSFLLLNIIVGGLLYVVCEQEMEFAQRFFIQFRITTIWDYVWLTCSISVLISLAALGMYFCGVVIHAIVKNIWNDVNKNDTLLAEKSAREEKRRKEKEAATKVAESEKIQSPQPEADAIKPKPLGTKGKNNKNSQE